MDLKYSLVIEATSDSTLLILKDSLASVIQSKIVFTRQNGEWKSTLQCWLSSSFPYRILILILLSLFRTKQS